MVSQSIVVHSRSVDAVPLSTFYLYSSTVGTVIPQNIDDGSSDIITLLTAFPFSRASERKWEQNKDVPVCSRSSQSLLDGSVAT